MKTPMTQATARATEIKDAESNDQPGAFSPRERIVALINLTNELSALMAEETALLKDQRPAALAPLQERKANLAAAYAVAIRDMAADRRDLSSAGAGLLQDLRDITSRFEGQAREQRAMLAGKAEVVEGVMRAVAEEARPQSSTYGQSRSGQVTKGLADAAHTPQPIAFDQRG